MQQINTPKEFRKAVFDILDKYRDNYSGSLEEYLRSLWSLVIKYKAATVTYTFLLNLLEEAFSTEPAKFDSQWLNYEKPIHWNYQDNTYVIEQLENHKVKIIERDVDEIRILKHTLLFQIADLYKMRDNELKNEHKYLGISSPTGNSWYNFDIFTYLECATRGMEDHAKASGSEFKGCDWVELAVILELGRLYE